MSGKEYIICSAIHFKDRKRHEHSPKNITSGFVMAGRRHHNCFTLIFELVPSEKRRKEIKKETVQGFLTNLDRFVDRSEAATIAFNAGQTKVDHGILMSEHLY